MQWLKSFSSSLILFVWKFVDIFTMTIGMKMQNLFHMNQCKKKKIVLQIYGISLQPMKDIIMIWIDWHAGFAFQYTKL